MKTSTKQDSCGIRGDITLRTFSLNTERGREIDALLRDSSNMEPARYQELVDELATLEEAREITLRNQVVLSGRAVLARILAGDFTYTGEINYGALGTSSTAVSDSQTQLVAETARKQFARRVRTNAAIAFDFFYSKADTSGTYQEFGMFIDGTVAANSGQLFNRLLTGGWTKTSNEAMTVSVTITLSAA